MNDFSEISAYSQHKTRVLIYSSHQKVAELTLYVLEFFGKNADYFLENGNAKKTDNDFVILETSNVQYASDFRPNIALISEEIKDENLSSLLKNITAGGVLIYSEKIAEVVDPSENYFRRLPFTAVELKNLDHQLMITTEMGSIPLLTTDENLIKNIHGIQLLCQQFGIMEEDFYEALMGFE